ncbi:hypothetical protein N9Y00_07930 [Tateyamaria sp.]|nr:hypothetical protein [Tateyamaria sp.]
MLNDIIYHLNRQIETHQFNYACPDDLRILMSERQLCLMERELWLTYDAPRHGMDPYTYYGHQPANRYSTEPTPARFHNVEIITTIEDMPVPQVVRIASI